MFRKKNVERMDSSLHETSHDKLLRLSGIAYEELAAKTCS